MTRGFARILLAAGVAMALLIAGGRDALAQAQNWIQIEAHPDLATAQTRVRAYARMLDGVNGFALRSGWYAVALGPYPPDEAERRLAGLLAQGIIPSDSYLVGGGAYGQRFWPLAAAGDIDATPAPETPDETPGETPGETPAQARQSERALDRPAREALQTALQWFGHYTAAVDGDFGPATRRAMADWQRAQGREATGVLTTAERALLLAIHRADLDALGMQRVTDARAGIAIDLPMAMVRFGRYDYPFAHYESRGDSGVRVLLISQAGDSSTLGGLFELMQTLDIVPPEGARHRDADAFVLTGRSDRVNSHTVARLRNGQIKGFTLVWTTPGREAQMARVAAMMEQSLTMLDPVLDPGAADPAGGQSVDLVAGLELRRPAIARTGFYADARGAVLTTTEVLGPGCERLLIDGLYEADTVFRDDALGLALLRPREALAPSAHARIAATPARIRSQVAVAGFPYDGALGLASLNIGTLADLRGPDGQEGVQRLALDTRAGEAGAPVLDPAGAVVGIVLPRPDSGRTLPEGVSLALRADLLAPVLEPAGIALSPATDDAPMGSEALARFGAGIAVLVTCWN